MRILLWHGYLLRGSGSNIYTSNIARVWRDEGHQVLVMCQQRDVSDLDFVDAAGDFDDANREPTVPLHPSSSGGTCVVLRPNIGRVLPVYVHDEYEGFDAKLFIDLSDEELDDYTQRNITAMVTAIEHFRPDAIITGHEVMGPFIAQAACSRTDTSYVAKLHGSALEYAVKLQQRYVRCAAEGLDGARRVVGGSRYMIEEAASVIPGHWISRATVVNPGCDVELFRPRPRSDPQPIAAYVGKFIPPKGVHNLLMALGATKTPGLRAVIVGYGSFEDVLREMAEMLARGDLDSVEAIARREGLDGVRRFLQALDDRSSYARRAGEVPITYTGRLEHEPLAELLPTFDLLVVPSILPEAFGMVAAEAAACGVLPIVPRHSGIGEVGTALEHDLGVEDLLTFHPATPITGIADRIDAVLGLPSARRRALSERAVEVARTRWSWRRVADDLVFLASS